MLWTQFTEVNIVGTIFTESTIYLLNLMLWTQCTVLKLMLCVNTLYLAAEAHYSGGHGHNNVMTK